MSGSHSIYEYVGYSLRVRKETNVQAVPKETHKSHGNKFKGINYSTVQDFPILCPPALFIHTNPILIPILFLSSLFVDTISALAGQAHRRLRSRPLSFRISDIDVPWFSCSSLRRIWRKTSRHWDCSTSIARMPDGRNGCVAFRIRV